MVGKGGGGVIVVGITGSLASGKSEAARFFKEKGARVFDADHAARRAISKGKPAWRAIVKIFGKDYLKKNGEVDRAKLADRVFSQPRDLRKLDILIHPGVIFDSLLVIERLRKKPGILVLDVPLLFESKMENLADVTVVIRSSRAKILRRAEKKGLSRKLAGKILSTQWPMEKKVKLADFVIDNNGSLGDLRKKVFNLAKEIQTFTEERKSNGH